MVFQFVLVCQCEQQMLFFVQSKDSHRKLIHYSARIDIIQHILIQTPHYYGKCLGSFSVHVNRVQLYNSVQTCPKGGFLCSSGFHKEMYMRHSPSAFPCCKSLLSFLEPSFLNFVSTSIYHYGKSSPNSMTTPIFSDFHTPSKTLHSLAAHVTLFF